MKVLRLIQAAAKHRVPTTLDVGVSITVSRTAESRDAGDAVWDLQVRTTHADVSLRRWLIQALVVVPWLVRSSQVVASRLRRDGTWQSLSQTETVEIRAPGKVRLGQHQAARRNGAEPKPRPSFA